MGDTSAPLTEWAGAISAQWRAKYGRDPLAAWGQPQPYRLPSGQVVLGDTVAKCQRFKRLGAVKVDG